MASIGIQKQGGFEGGDGGDGWEPPATTIESGGKGGCPASVDPHDVEIADPAPFRPEVMTALSGWGN